MAFCSNCGTEILDLDKFCPSCGYKTPLKIQEIQNRNNKIKSAAATTEDIIMGIVGIPFLSIGLGIVFIGTLVLFIRLDSPLNAFIQFVFLAIMGAVIAKIGMWIIEHIPEGNVNGWSRVLSLIGAIIIVFIGLPGYLENISMFY